MAPVMPPRVEARYKAAMALFAEILTKQPHDLEAQAGHEACEEMLNPYMPAQYSVPPPEDPLEEAELLQPPPVRMRDSERLRVQEILEETLLGSENKTEEGPPRPKTWEIRRGFRESDEAAVERMSGILEEDASRRQKEIDLLVAGAAEQLKAEANGVLVWQQTLLELVEKQDEADVAWKGQGPQLIEEAIRSLAAVVKLPLELLCQAAQGVGIPAQVIAALLAKQVEAEV